MHLLGKPAMYSHKENNGVRCELCPHRCLVLPGKSGICRMRRNRDGMLVAEGYGIVSSIALDPIEKKPLFHFYPGSSILSLGSYGCNLRCLFCQNWQISQTQGKARPIVPKDVLNLAKTHQSDGCVGVAFTYNEPLIWYEFILETAPLLKAAGLKTVLVTNGYLSRLPWDELIQHIDALNVDVKAWDDDFYGKMCGARLGPVLDNLAAAKDKCHIELTYLVIPDHNDDDASLEGFARWVYNNLGADTPVHFSRYFPSYRLEIPATPTDVLKRARALAGKWLDFVYLGNVGL
ncbi:MAG: AmmeMemoRadiSam system radical SAM enzyme [Firmicutes bacterium]|nr:AmmeMemoRadiSam system radical SAM enzyme [Bacillota bacterium]